jgi:raffinose/stachyose/melibiose transport system permease protein
VSISRTERIVNQLILAVFAVFAVVPLLGVLLSSVTPASENSGGFAIPDSVDLGNYGAAWSRGNFSSYLFSSVLVTVSVVILSVVLATFAGYAFARMQFRGSSVLFYLLLIGLTLPTEAFIIPLYFNLRTVGLTDTYWALILPQTAQSLAFAVFWMRNQFRAFPGEIIEAARLDGCSDLRLLWRVVVPPSLAPMMTMAVVITMWTWNEFLLPLVMVVSDSKRTAPLGLAFFQGQHLTDYSLLAAAGVMVALPIAVLFFALQKRFINGMVGGISSR